MAPRRLSAPRARLFFLLILASVLLAVLPGCDDDASGDEATDTTADASDTAVTADASDTATAPDGDDAPQNDTDTSATDTADTASGDTSDTSDTRDVLDASDVVDTTDATDASDTTEPPPDFECVCDQVIAADESVVDLSATAPGNVVCLAGDASGARSQLRLSGIAGTAAEPIIITSCDAALTVESNNHTAALSLTGSHFRVTGAGLDGVDYGLRFGAPGAYAAIGLGRADHFEIDHVEIYASNFAGIMAKVDPGKGDCTENDRRFDPWVMDGVDIHHNWIHDVAGEGLYLGNSFYNGADRYCATEASCDWSACDAAGYAVRVQYPHSVRAVRVQHNLVEDTGWDGLQIGAADADCVISDNIVRRYGLEGIGAHSNGIQTGGGSTCDVLRNTIVSGRVGLHLSGLGDVVVANNVFIDIAEHGIAPNAKRVCGGVDQNPCDDLIRPFAPSAEDEGFKGPVRIGHNTLVMSGPTADAYPVRPYGNEHFPGEQVYNNLVVYDGDDWQRNRLGAWDVQGNVHVQTLAEGGFVDAAASDLHLTSGSPAVDAGVDVSSWGLVDDLEGTARPQGAGWDAGAYEDH